MLKKILAAILLTFLPSLLFAADPVLERPRWSLEVKGGVFVPKIEDWSTYYGDRDAGTYGGTLSYKILTQVEAGVGGRYVRASGHGNAPFHGTITGDVTYELAPLNVFVLLRGRFSENQWLIPYAGGGWTRMFYREEVVGQSTARGYANGSHARAGIQLVLDGMDPHAAHRMRSDYGVDHTSLFVEMESIRAEADSVSGIPVELGGKSLMAGLLFEF